MSQFTFMHNTYEFPDDVSVIVHYVDCCGDQIADFDFYKDGRVISVVASYDDEGNDEGGWHAHGIRRVKRVHYEDLA